MTSGRWDIVLRVRSGPTASAEPVVFQGPVVAVGTAPGPGGVKLPAGRGIAPQHCTIAVYDPRSVWVTPTGPNPVRLAPYADVRWEDIEPVSGRVRLERGNAVHLGPTGQRGVTLELVECRDLGMQDIQRVVSQAADAVELVEHDVARPPDAFVARREVPSVRELMTDTMDARRLRWAVGVLVTGTALMAAVAMVLLLVRWSAEPPVDSPEYFKIVDLAVPVGAPALPGLEGAFDDQLLSWNRAYAGGVVAGTDSRDPASWDRHLFLVVQEAVRRGQHGKFLYRLLEQRRSEYLTVLRALRAHQPPLPDVLAAVPIQESNYNPTLVSPCCAGGPWQFMPEAGFRYRSMPGFGEAYSVKACGWKGSDGTPWTPTRPFPPSRACEKAPYVMGGRCALAGCEKDFRLDLKLSTDAAMYSFAETLADPTIAGSGAAVQIAIAGHNAGYDDRRWMPDVEKRFNVLPALRRWAAKKDAAVPLAWFVGENLKCAEGGETGSCTTAMMPETQAYVVKILMYQLLAVCYFGRNPGEAPEFKQWSRHVEPGGYCASLEAWSPDRLGEGRR
jgi:hypothetical protein